MELAELIKAIKVSGVTVELELPRLRAPSGISIWSGSVPVAKNRILPQLIRCKKLVGSDTDIPVRVIDRYESNYTIVLRSMER